MTNSELDEKQILNLAWTLQANARNLVWLEADLNEYGNLKKAIESLGQELKELESQKKKRELNDVMVMQECAMLAPLIKAARGEVVEYNQLKLAIASALGLAINRKALDIQEAACLLRNAGEEAPKYSLQMQITPDYVHGFKNHSTSHENIYISTLGKYWSKTNSTAFRTTPLTSTDKTTVP